MSTAHWHDRRVAAFAARRAGPRPLILSDCGSAAVTAVFGALLGWLLAETRDGSVLGLAERLTTSIQTCWPFIVAVALHRTRHPRPALATGGSSGVKDGAAGLPGLAGWRRSWCGPGDVRAGLGRCASSCHIADHQNQVTAAHRDGR